MGILFVGTAIFRPHNFYYFEKNILYTGHISGYGIQCEI